MAGRCVGVLCRRLCSSTAAPVAGEQVKPGFWERMKNRKFVVWTKSLLHDYGEACKDIAVGAKERPGKAALYISLLAGMGICSSKAPAEDSFQSSMLEASSCLLLLSPWTRSGKSDQHVQRLMELRNQGRLRHINLLIFSLMYEAPYDPGCDLYSTQCSHLKPRWAEFPGRVLDVGFFGRWWLLQNKMEDFDINEEEFTHLPAHMRNISYNDLHSEENEKRYQSKWKPIVLSQEQLEKMEAEGQLKYLEAEERLKRMEAERLKRIEAEEQLKHKEAEEQLKHKEAEEGLKPTEAEEQLEYMEPEEQLKRREPEEQLKRREVKEQLKYMEAEEQLKRREAKEELKYSESQEWLARIETRDQQKHMEAEEQQKHMEAEEQLEYTEVEEQLKHKS